MRILNFEFPKITIGKKADTSTPIKKPSVEVPPTSVRRSLPSIDNYITDLKTGVTFINPGYIKEVIPVIRKLSWINPDVGSALNDMVQLTNTGHTIKFDQKISPEQRDSMRRHLREARKSWADGVSGIDGLVNKMIAQIWIAGALSTEWVVNNNKTRLSNCVLVNPETIVFSWVKSLKRFIPYQKQSASLAINGIAGEKLVKLSSYTYKYMGLNGDTEIPYGIPPFLTALANIDIQNNMDKNISYIMDQLGLLGFFETLVEKPAKADGTTDAQYKAYLTKYLDDIKIAVSKGLKDGTIVGFKDDHEFEFHNTTKNLSGSADLYTNNEVKVATGLKTAPEFLGFPTGGSESGMSIIFQKMLSQLVNVQNIVKANLEFGYMLELTLAGFKDVSLEVLFKPSTITDELKYQQAQEYKIRNIENKYKMGVIGQQQKAEELGYDKPDQNEPREPIDTSGVDKKNREDSKDKSDRKTRDKNKPVPKRKDASTKPR